MAETFFPAAGGGGGGGQVILRAEGQAGNHVKATLGSKLVEGDIPEGGVLQLKLPGLGLWEVDTEAEDSMYHFQQEVKVYRYGITPCWAIAKKAFADCTPEEIQFVLKNRLWNQYGWQIGDQHEITMQNSESIYVQIYDFEHDIGADGEAVLPITLGMKDCFKEPAFMNPTITNVGGWTSCNFRTVTLPDILRRFPQEWQDIMLPCKKKSGAGNNSTSIVETEDTLFLLSIMEFSGQQGSGAAGEGKQYPIFASGNSTRIKLRDGAASAVLSRSGDVGLGKYFCYIGSDGSIRDSYGYNVGNASPEFGVCVAFCVG